MLARLLVKVADRCETLLWMAGHRRGSFGPDGRTYCGSDWAGTAQVVVHGAAWYVSGCGFGPHPFVESDDDPMRYDYFAAGHGGVA